jgi:hypothetical protein
MNPQFIDPQEHNVMKIHQSGRLFAVTLAAAITLFFAHDISAGEEMQYETEPAFDVSDILPPELISGEHYRVGDLVPTKGFKYLFNIESDYGQFTAEGRTMLDIRINEIRALAELKKMTKTEAFAKAAAKAASSPFLSALRVARHPIATIAGIPEGIGRSVGSAQRTGKKVVEETSGAAKSAFTEGDEGKETTDGKEDKNMMASGREMLIESDKRKLAAELGVDPYTDNELLQSELKRIATITSATGMATSFVMPGLGALSYVSTAGNLVWNVSEGELMEINSKTLTQMGVSDAAKKSFLANKNYSPSMITIFVQTLHAMAPGPGAGQEAVVSFASSVQTKSGAHYVIESLVMLGGYNSTKAPIKKFVATGYLLGGQNTEGVLVVPVALDYLVWTELVEEAVDDGRLEHGNRELWLAGNISDTASKTLADRDWKVYAETRNELIKAEK